MQFSAVFNKLRKSIFTKCFHCILLIRWSKCFPLAQTKRSAMNATGRLPCQRGAVSVRPDRYESLIQVIDVLDRCVLVSNHRYCSQPDWGLVILLAKVLVQSILQSPDVAMQQCPEPDVLERCPAGRRRSFLTCVWSLAEPSASAGHPGSMHHLPLLRVQQRTVCAAQLRDCCGYHDWRSGRSAAAGARYQHYASLLTKIRYSEHW